MLQPDTEIIIDLEENGVGQYISLKIEENLLVLGLKEVVTGKYRHWVTLSKRDTVEDLVRSLNFLKETVLKD